MILLFTRVQLMLFNIENTVQQNETILDRDPVHFWIHLSCIENARMLGW